MAEQTYGDWIRSNPPLPTKEYKHMAQQTAVEWLADKLINEEPYPIKWNKYIEQAKQMEKEQIVDAYKADRYPCSDEDAEEYYNKTYKTQVQ